MLDFISEMMPIDDLVESTSDDEGSESAEFDEDD